MLGEAGLRALIIIMDAHVHNIITPGSYHTRLSKTMQENNIPKINFPKENVNSMKLFDSHIIAEKLKKQYSEEQNSPKRKKSRGPEREEETREREEEEMEEGEIVTGEMPDLEEFSENEDILDQHMTREGITTDSTMLGIELITNKEFNKETKQIEPAEIKELYQKGKIKYIMNKDCKLSERNIENMILGQKIHCKTNKITYLKTSKYKQIKNGQTNNNKE